VERPKGKTIEFELARFFLALRLSLNKPQILDYLKKQILDDVEKNYNTLSDDQVDQWLARDK
jgi:hypothetical protein